jgi:hypothetical protein
MPLFKYNKDQAPAGSGGGVPETRQINTTPPLQGGGDLSANRTLSIDDATTGQKGAVQLAANNEVAAGKACNAADPRLSNARTPTAHTHDAAAIVSGLMTQARLGTGAGGGKFLKDDQTWDTPAGGPPSGAAGGDLASTYPNPEVAAIHETAGPTKLTVGSVPDLSLLARSGLALVGQAMEAREQAFARTTAAGDGDEAFAFAATLASGIFVPTKAIVVVSQDLAPSVFGFGICGKYDAGFYIANLFRSNGLTVERGVSGVAICRDSVGNGWVIGVTSISGGTFTLNWTKIGAGLNVNGNIFAWS